MRTTHEVPPDDDIPAAVLVGSFLLIAAGFTLMFSFPLLQPFFAALGGLLLGVLAISDEFAILCLIGFLIGLPFRALYLFSRETFGEPYTPEAR